MAGIIKSVDCGLVLESTGYGVKLQPASGSSSQLWILESIGDGKFYIVHKDSGKVLDVEGGNNKVVIAVKGQNLSIQKWFFHNDYRVVNASNGLVFDTPKKGCSAGNHIIVYNHHGKRNQQFKFEFKWFVSNNDNGNNVQAGH